MAQPTQATQAQPQSTTGAHNVFHRLVFAFGGVCLFAVLADLNEGLGHVLVALMAGFLLIWLLSHGQTISKMLNAVIPQG